MLGQGDCLTKDFFFACKNPCKTLKHFTNYQEMQHIVKDDWLINQMIGYLPKNLQQIIAHIRNSDCK